MSTRLPHQHEVIKGREAEMTQNSTGAYVFKVDDWKQLERFLVLGTEGGTYYISQEKLTRDNALAVLRCLDQDGEKVVKTITEISEAGRALKNDPALFALALASAHSNPVVRKAAFDALPKVARTATHLFHFADYMQSFRGWGKAARRAIASWYTEKQPKALAYQMIKYQQRDGWSHRDLMRLSHPVANSPEQEALFRYAVGGKPALMDTTRKIKKNGVMIEESRNDLSSFLHEQVEAFELIKSLTETDISTAIDLIERYDLPREAIPTQMLNSPDIWAALLKKMPMTAAIRNLGTMTKNGVFGITECLDKVMEMLTNEDHLKRSRIHPIQVLAALKVYSSGGGFRSKNNWTPIMKISDALDTAFYKTFKNVDPTGKRILLALDVSGSMGMATTSIDCLSAREATAAVALVTMATEENTSVVGFQDKLVELNISPEMKLEKVIKNISNLPFGSTDCSAPFAWARQKKKEFDAFCVYTDNETGSGSYWGRRPASQPSETLKEYRKTSGIPAKMVVVATCSNTVGIADPKDAGMLDICGFDGTVPSLISDFIRD